MSALAKLLHSPQPAPTPVPDLAAWWPQWQALQSTAESPAALALHSGHTADRVAWAFAGGYQAALRALLPSLQGPELAALCVTEATGNRPRDIQTRVVPQPDGTLRIDGAKRWTTLGPNSATLLVAGVWSPGGSAAPSSRPELRVVQVHSAMPGVELQAMPPTRFVPEVPHASVLLREVRVPASALLAGDGYERYVKPFRTVEDIHVMLAVGAYLLRESRSRGWPAAFAERLVAQLALLSVLAEEDPSAAPTHLALAGVLRVLEQLFAESDGLWPAADAGDAAADRWRRDTPLLQVAGAARSQRATRAWQSLTGPAPPSA
jgi:acyl-CoA dehydrogenase